MKENSLFCNEFIYQDFMAFWSVEEGLLSFLNLVYNLVYDKVYT